MKLMSNETESFSAPHSQKMTCNFCSNVPVNPSTRNVVFTFSTHWDTGLTSLITSLRSVNRFCRIVVFTFQNFTTSEINRIRSSLSTSIEIETVSITKISVPLLFDDPSTLTSSGVKIMSRFFFYRNWLLKHKHEIDAVLHVDAFDIIFFGDPFYLIQPQTLTLIFEGKLISEDSFNWAWIHQCYNRKVADSLGKNMIVNSGTIGGGIQPFLIFLESFLRIPEITSNKCKKKGIDQGHFNVLVWRSVLQRRGIIPKTYSCDIAYTAESCSSLMNSVSIPGNISTGKVPISFHQYNRFKDQVRELSKVCPNGWLRHISTKKPKSTIQ